MSVDHETLPGDENVTDAHSSQPQMPTNPVDPGIRNSDEASKLPEGPAQSDGGGDGGLSSSGIEPMGAAGAAPTPGADALKTAYEQLCASYRAIDDFRTKLLGLLPLATGTGVLVLLSTLARLEPGSAVNELLTPVACFGFLVTLGLFVYEIYGIAKCADLIFRGRVLEEALCLRDGEINDDQFDRARCKAKFGDRLNARLAPALGFGGEMDGMSFAQFGGRPQAVAHLLNEPFAAALIYPSALAAWTYLALWGANIKNWSHSELAAAAVVVLIVGFVIVWIYAVLVSRYYNDKITWWRETAQKEERATPLPKLNQQTPLPQAIEGLDQAFASSSCKNEIASEQPTRKTVDETVESLLTFDSPENPSSRPR